jgi:hypothetical protein
MSSAEERAMTPARAPFEQIGAGVVEIYEGLRRAVAEGIFLSAFVASLLVLAGFGAFFLAWRGAAATLVVGVQIPYLLSGGATGFALIGGGMGLIYIQMSRHLGAREDAEWAVVLDHALGILGGIRARGRLGRRALAPDDDRAR